MLYRKLLFYYSILIATLLFVWIILFAPRPASLIPLFLLLPLCLHFWLGVVWPHRSKSGNEADRKETALRHDRLIIFGGALFVTLFVSTLSILIFSLMYENYSPIVKNVPKALEEIATTNEGLEDVLKRLDSLESKNADALRSFNRIYEDNLDAGDKETLGAEDDALVNLESLNDKTATREASQL